MPIWRFLRTASPNAGSCRASRLETATQPGYLPCWVPKGECVVHVTIEAGLVNFDVEGIDKIWSFKSRLTIPLTHIRSVKIDTEAARGWWHGLRLLGTQIPGVLTAGTFYEDGGIVFYDVHDPDKTIVLELDHEKYRKLIVEVESPHATLKALEKAY